MNIVLIANNDYYDHLRNCIKMLRNTQPKNTKIYCLTEDDLNFEDENIFVFNMTKNKEYTELSDLNIHPTHPRIMLARCLAPDFINEDKVLFLDIDTIVIDSLIPMWNINIDDFYLCGVLDYNCRRFWIPEYNNIPSYVLLASVIVNFKKIREDGIDKEIKNLIKTHKLLFPEQDAYNIACKDKVKPISSKWLCDPSLTWRNEEIVVGHDSCYKVWGEKSIFHDAYFQVLGLKESNFEVLS